MNVKIKNVINPHILNEEWIGFHGDSEYVDENGVIQMGYWNFLGITDNTQGEVPWDLDDEIPEKVLYSDYLVPVLNKNGNICVVEFMYKKE